LVYSLTVVESIFGSQSAARVLLYLENYGSGYALGIAKTFRMPLNAIQRQLKKFESSGVLVSRLVGKTREYTWNPRVALVKPLRAFLHAALTVLDESELREFYRERRRPRRIGKPL
jgi:predicted transcriptional regulator